VVEKLRTIGHKVARTASSRSCRGRT
jgi:hypothetical protein